MKTVVFSAAVAVAFLIVASEGFAESQRVDPPLVLVKEPVATFDAEDFPWDLPEGRTEDVIVPLGDAVLTIPWMDVEKNGEDSVTITAPELFITEGSDWSVDGGVMIENAEMLIRRRGEAMVATGLVQALNIDDGGKTNSSAAVKGFEFALTSSGYAPALKAIDANAEAGSPEMVAAMRALTFALDYSVESARMRVSDDETEPFDVELTSGPAESNLFYGDGRLAVSVEGRESTFSANGPIPAKGEIGLISYDFKMPVEKSKTPQPMGFSMEVSDVSINEGIWALMDPEELFPREFDKMKIDVGMDIILNESLFEDTRRGSESLEPVEMSIRSFEFDGLGLDIAAEGNAKMKGELPESISAFMSISGLSKFMANAVQAGMVPQAQAILAEGIALQFGKEESDGSLTFDVKTKDGMVWVNDNRLAPLPQ